jgi:hypothetical protein
MSDVIVNGYKLRLHDKDEVQVREHDCGRCGSNHTELTVERNGKEITRIGDYITLHDEDELFGDVALDDKYNTIPEYKWKIHIVEKMTDDKLHYLGYCGNIPNKKDRISWKSDIRFIPKEHEVRLCPECLKKLSKA